MTRTLRIIAVSAAQLIVHAGKHVSTAGASSVDNLEGDLLVKHFTKAVEDHTKHAFRAPEVRENDSQEADWYLQAFRTRGEAGGDAGISDAALFILLCAAAARRLLIDLAEPAPNFTDFMGQAL